MTKSREEMIKGESRTRTVDAEKTDERLTFYIDRPDFFRSVGIDGAAESSGEVVYTFGFDKADGSRATLTEDEAFEKVKEVFGFEDAREFEGWRLSGFEQTEDGRWRIEYVEDRDDEMGVDMDLLWVAALAVVVFFYVLLAW